MEAETARVTLFEGGDIMYGNNVKLTAQRVWTGLTVGGGGGGEKDGDGGGEVVGWWWRRERWWPGRG